MSKQQLAPQLMELLWELTNVASLPIPQASYTGARAVVTDANATLTAGIGAIVVGGGANIVPVFCDGSAWRIG